MTTFPAASPSRATLQSVNDFLLTSSWEQQSTTSVQRSNPQALSASPPLTRDPSSRLFETLSGEWHLRREITNFHRDGFAGVVSGTATFLPRPPTSEDAMSEYLYIESGTFKTTSGLEMQMSRRWIWRLRFRETSPAADPKSIVSIHFVKADGETEDYLYNELGFSDREADKMVANAEHPCGEDFYESTYEMIFNGEKARTLEKFEVIHKVHGPAKDYISKTWYTS